MAIKTYIELDAGESTRLREALLDIKEGADHLCALPRENFEGMREDSVRERIDRVGKIAENITIALDEIRGILDY